MIATLSATEHDYYAMPLPFAVYSWAKLGVHSIVFVPSGDNPKLKLAERYCFGMAAFKEFTCEEKRIPTYSQVSRLFAAAVPTLDGIEDVLITSDSDMCVFSDFFKQFENTSAIIGYDLTPSEQYPMCYLVLPISKWKKIFNINKSYQEHIAELIDPIEGLNIRGEQWSYDQWYAKKMIDASGEYVFKIPRSNGQNQFALNRADRDGWNFDSSSIIDAHLPRPLTDWNNFQKVVDLFHIKYPNDDLKWMSDYYTEYFKLC